MKLTANLEKCESYMYSSSSPLLLTLCTLSSLFPKLAGYGELSAFSNLEPAELKLISLSLFLSRQTSNAEDPKEACQTTMHR